MRRRTQPDDVRRQYDGAIVLIVSLVMERDVNGHEQFNTVRLKPNATFDC